ncbi:MAG: YqgE/AlgH family protein [Thermoguttaceae bacterium]
MTVSSFKKAPQPCIRNVTASGWGPGQIEDEIEQGVWRVLPALADQIFSRSGRLWEQLAREVLEIQMKLLLNVWHIPGDLQLN